MAVREQSQLRRESTRAYTANVEPGPAGCAAGCSALTPAPPSSLTSLLPSVSSTGDVGSGFFYGSSHGLCGSVQRTDSSTFHCLRTRRAPWQIADQRNAGWRCWRPPSTLLDVASLLPIEARFTTAHSLEARFTLLQGTPSR